MAGLGDRTSRNSGKTHSGTAKKFYMMQVQRVFCWFVFFFLNSDSLKYVFCKTNEIKTSGSEEERQELENRTGLVHTDTHTHNYFVSSEKKWIWRAQDFNRTHNCGKVTWRCQTTGNYQKNLSAQSAAIFIVLWQISTQSGTPGLAPGPALTNCQGRGAVICLRWGFLRSLLQTCGFTFPLSLQEMAGQWNAE